MDRAGAEDSRSQDAEFAASSNQASLAALRSATVLRLAKATFLFSLSGAIALMAVLPFCVARRVSWWGIECGPLSATESTLGQKLEQLDVLQRKVDGATQIEEVIGGLGNRIDGLADRVDMIARRTLVDGCSFSVVCGQTEAAVSAAPQISTVRVEPVETGDNGALTPFMDSWLYANDPDGFRVVARGMRFATKEMRFRVTWIGLDGGVLDQKTALFEKLVGKWDRDSDVVACAGVDVDRRLARVQFVRKDP